MADKIPETMALIRDNIKDYHNPLAVSSKENAAWAKDLGLAKQGPLLFYTGGEYQLLPFMDALMGVAKIVPTDTKAFSGIMELRNFVHKTGLAPEKIFASIFAVDKDRFFAINRKAVLILKALGYDIAYDSEKEIYSGALLFEMGMKETAKEYAKDLGAFFRQSGAKTVVCMSPHAAEVLRFEYPKFNDFPELEVKTFIELVADRKDRLPAYPGRLQAVVHDSCKLARELDTVEPIREVLAAIGVETVEAERHGRWTTCCGGPVKITYPEIAHKISRKRYAELAKTGAELALTSCPYCLSALLSADPKKRFDIIDLVELIAEGYDYE